MAQILFLHGASSAGKSSIARALQAQSETPLLHLSIDHFRDSGAVPGFGKDRTRWRAMRGAFFDGFHNAVAGFAAAGTDVVLEHILEEPEWLADITQRFAPFDVVFIGVQCPLEVLEAREAARGDRHPGSAADDFARVHDGLRYDLEVDGTAPPEENAALILRVATSSHRVSPFATDPSLPRGI